MLAQTDFSLSEIAYASGFSDQSHPARHFRHMVGTTPSRPENGTKPPDCMVLINRLTKVTNDPIVQDASPVDVIAADSNEHRRIVVPDFDEVSCGT